MADTLTQEPVRGSAIPRFALAEPEHRDWGHFAGVGAGSVGVHIVLLLFVGVLAEIPGQRYSAPQIALELRPRDATKLVAPPSALTQRAPNRGPLSQEFNIASLPPRAERPNIPASPGAAALPRQKFTLPDRKDAAAPGVPTVAPDAPTIDPSQIRAAAPPPPALGNIAAPPPQIEPAEKPKLTFERPGVPMGSPGQIGVGRMGIPTPSRRVEDAARQVARGGGGGLIVGDEDAGNPGMSPSSPAVPIPGKLGSSVELLSDPQGVDFWPYLVKILSTVRRNWFAVIPESARYGRQGRVAVQFAINRDGTVPKLVIAGPSGADALDRASVAAISASNPFPPLPADFRGGQIRLQLLFKYNVR
jgi:TonB family protein